MAYKPQVLAISDGGTGLTASLPIIQIVRNTSSALITATGTVPFDDTIPQLSETANVINVTITPKNSNNILLLQFFGSGSSNAATDFPVICFFQDAGTSAIFATQVTQSAQQFSVTPSFYMTAGTTSATTFKVQAGTVTGGALYFNGLSAARIFGGVNFTSFIVTEFSA